ncbi:hypothetical protein Mgra_00003512 [Meloidogyne graminicola]|uniref:Uncharacterized protein n=1 Tax=Meloidogyne graminicola TaxID=189291 RepID=A0A8S9ZVG8_9BILA|nr:hypothetical protein Mgra_00003512 [Meloidogyne graminicola]
MLILLLFYYLINSLFLIKICNGFGFGGGCGCPCMPQPCIPQPPPIALPSLCFPQIPLPCPPPSCGCCGRKKRENKNKILISTKSGIKRIGEEKSHCNNLYIKRIILKNLIVGDMVGSRNAIHSELRAKLGGNYIISCAHTPEFSYSADSTIDYCIEGHQKNKKIMKIFNKIKKKQRIKLATMDCCITSTISIVEDSDLLKTTTKHLLSTQNTHHYLINCTTEEDNQGIEKCVEWQRAGFCKSHPATKWLFCRKQCLCF